MSRRAGLGRHITLDDAAGDPLDGLVNLFDIGIVLAVAFLLAGLGLTLGEQGRATGADGVATGAPRGARALSSPANAPQRSGRGAPVGTVYRLADGRLVYVAKPAR